MMKISDKYEALLAELKSHSSFYENLPFDTGTFLLITNYKLIGNYKQVTHLLQNNRCDQQCLDEFKTKRKTLHEEHLFQLEKALSLSSFTEKELAQLHTFKTLHERLLEETGELH